LWKAFAWWPHHFTSILSVPDEGYSRNASCPLNLISTFFFINPATFYWSACTKPWMRTIMYLCGRGFDIVSFYDFSIWFWNCSVSVVFFYKILELFVSVVFCYKILELFRQCRIFCFSFYYWSSLGKCLLNVLIWRCVQLNRGVTNDNDAVKTVLPACSVTNSLILRKVREIRTYFLKFTTGRELRSGCEHLNAW
jgi:hypothetical protein